MCVGARAVCGVYIVCVGGVMCVGVRDVRGVGA